MSNAMVSNADVVPAGSVSPRGLHGHSLEEGAAPALLAECIGTCILVLTIIGTVIAASLARPVAGLPYGSLAVPLAAGVVLTSLVAALGPISGAHLNPALTIGLAINGRFGWARVSRLTWRPSSLVPSLQPSSLGSSTAAGQGASRIWGPPTRRGESGSVRH